MVGDGVRDGCVADCDLGLPGQGSTHCWRTAENKRLKITTKLDHQT